MKQEEKTEGELKLRTGKDEKTLPRGKNYYCCALSSLSFVRGEINRQLGMLFMWGRTNELGGKYLCGKTVTASRDLGQKERLLLFRIHAKTTLSLFRSERRRDDILFEIGGRKVAATAAYAVHVKAA